MLAINYVKAEPYQIYVYEWTSCKSRFSLILRGCFNRPNKLVSFHNSSVLCLLSPTITQTERDLARDLMYIYE